MGRSDALAAWTNRHGFVAGLLVGAVLGWVLASSQGEPAGTGAAAPTTTTGTTVTTVTTVTTTPTPDPSPTTGRPEPTDEPPEITDSPEPKRTNAAVTRVVDGDTIDVLFRGSAVTVRLIGIDTPETVHPTEPVECFGKAASNFTTTGLEGKDVRLEFDVERTDRYGRTLAYVWVGRELFNETLVRRGFATVSTYPPNVKYVARFLAAQRQAREGGAGLWGACEQGAEEQPPPDQSGGGCDPSYQGACIPPYPPDLDCSDVGATNFQVVGDDPHGFDGDGDGVACEI